jgi:hypothetical protein
MMKAVRTSETPVNFNVTTRRYIPEDSKLRSLCCFKLSLQGLNFFSALVPAVEIFFLNFIIMDGFIFCFKITIQYCFTYSRYKQKNLKVLLELIMLSLVMGPLRFKIVDP